MSYREAAKDEREARITEALQEAGGPLTARAITRAIYGGPAQPAKSMIARVTQSLLVMESEGIVIRGGTHRKGDWRLAR